MLPTIVHYSKLNHTYIAHKLQMHNVRLTSYTFNELATLIKTKFGDRHPVLMDPVHETLSRSLRDRLTVLHFVLSAATSCTVTFKSCPI